MSQDNNEAASAPAGAYIPGQAATILAKQVVAWTKERDRLQGLINAASASQSSTAGAARGGNTKPIGIVASREDYGVTVRWSSGVPAVGTELFAHVARQRQESGAVYAHAVEQADGHVSLLMGEACEAARRFWAGSGANIRNLYDHPTPSAAVAEGVDAASRIDFDEWFNEHSEGAQLRDGKDLRELEQAFDAVCAQQREAGRREERHEFKNFHRQLCMRFGYTHDERDWKRDQVSLIEFIANAQKQGRAELDTRSIEEQSNAWFAVCGVLSELRPKWQFEQSDSARNCKEAAVATIRAIARQPVSEGLTLPSPTIIPLPKPHMELSHEEGSEPYPVFTRNHMHYFARQYAAAIAAVPPAKAEGMSDTERDAVAAAAAIHYPDCWDDVAYPNLESALSELYHWFKCSEDCQKAAQPAPIPDDAASETVGCPECDGKGYKKSHVRRMSNFVCSYCEGSGVLAQQAKKGNQQ